MKKFKLFTLSLLVLLLTGCAGKPIMPPIKYDKPIDFHVKKNAALRWEVGKQYAGAIRSYDSCDAGLVGGAISAAINSADRANNPSRYTLSYGKAEQAIFMTSFRNVLEQNQVFKTTELITDAKEVSAKDVLITVFFKTSRVSSPEKGNKITLTVDMTIVAQGKPAFKRTYLVQSNAEGYDKGFVDQQYDVSQRLLEKLISGIQEWQQ